MNIITLNTNQDGTLLGVDDTGQLYTGTVSQIGYDKLTRNVISNTSSTIHYQDLAGDLVVTEASVEKANYVDAPHEKVFVTAYDQDGNSSSIEKTYTVTNWVAK